MHRAVALTVSTIFLLTMLAHADIVVLRDGKSYSGTFTGEPSGKLAFQDNAGIQYTFPLTDVQTVVFSNLADNISLRGGQMYAGHWVGVTRISFRGSNGIGYVFPIRDVASLVLTHHAPQAEVPSAAGSTPTMAPPPQAAVPVAAAPQSVPPAPASYQPQPPYGQSPAATSIGMSSVVIPSNTQITVRTDGAIDSSKDKVGQLYPAEIEQDIVDSTGAVGIPAGTNAELQVVDLSQGQNGEGGKNLALDLYSVTLNGREYRVDSSSVAEKGSANFGMNKRTAEYAGGGAGFGALMGAIFGGGKGAGIGALAGGGLGAVTQYLTRGKQVTVPAESTLTFQVQQTLVLHP